MKRLHSEVNEIGLSHYEHYDKKPDTDIQNRKSYLDLTNYHLKVMYLMDNATMAADLEMVVLSLIYALKHDHLHVQAVRTFSTNKVYIKPSVFLLSQSWKGKSGNTTPITPPHPPKRPRTGRLPLTRRAKSLSTSQPIDPSLEVNAERAVNSAGKERKKERIEVSEEINCYPLIKNINELLTKQTTYE